MRSRSPKNDKPAETEKPEKLQESGGFLSNYLFAAFKQEPLPEGLDPNSAEALSLCKYIRDYSRKTDRESLEKDKLDRISSWNPVGFVST